MFSWDSAAGLQWTSSVEFLFASENKDSSSLKLTLKRFENAVRSWKTRNLHIKKGELLSEFIQKVPAVSLLRFLFAHSNLGCDFFHQAVRIIYSLICSDCFLLLVLLLILHQVSSIFRWDTWGCWGLPVGADVALSEALFLRRRGHPALVLLRPHHCVGSLHFHSSYFIKDIAAVDLSYWCFTFPRNLAEFNKISDDSPTFN